MIALPCHAMRGVGTRRRRPAKRLNFRIAGELLQAQLQQLGIALKLQGLDESTFGSIAYSNAPPSKRDSILTNRWWPDFNDPYDECNILLNAADAGATGANFGFYHNKQVDALLARMKTASGEGLVRYAHEMQDIASSLKGLIINPVEIEAYDFYSTHR